MADYDQLWRQRREIAERIIDRAAHDLVFRRQLLEDPRYALDRSGLAEAIRRARSTDDVSGYGSEPQMDDLLSLFEQLYSDQ